MSRISSSVTKKMSLNICEFVVFYVYKEVY